MDTKQAYEDIKKLVDSFIDVYFDDDDIIPSFFFKLIEELKDDEFIDISRGKPEIWASTIVVIIGRLNFLFDKSVPGSLKGLHTVCNFFNTSKSTVGNKASLIQDELEIKLGDEKYSREEIADSLNAVELPNGFVLTVKHFKEIEALVGKLTHKNFEKKMSEYHRLTEEARKEERLINESDQLKHQKELREKRIVEMDERSRLAKEEKQQKIKAKWEKEKENQPDFLDIFGIE